MRFRLRETGILLAPGIAVAFLVLTSLSWGWMAFYGVVVFVFATGLLFLICRQYPGHPFVAGFVASLPGLLIPAFLWIFVLQCWKPLAEAKANGDLYGNIHTMGDPHSILTISRYLLFPIGLVLASGLLAGTLANASIKRRLSTPSLE